MKFFSWEHFAERRTVGTSLRCYGRGRWDWASAIQGFVKAGARVAAIYHANQPNAEQRRFASWYRCDARDRAAVFTLFDRIVENMDGIDALVNTAGTWRPTLPEKIDDLPIDSLLETNLKSTIYLNQAA